MNKEEFRRKLRQLGLSSLIVGTAATASMGVTSCGNNQSDNKSPEKIEHVAITKENATDILLQAAGQFSKADHKSEYASSQTLYNSVQTAINNGADINAQDANGNTALMLLLTDNNQDGYIESKYDENYAQTINLILEQNPDLTIENKNGINASDCAETMYSRRIYSARAGHNDASPLNKAISRKIKQQYEAQIASMPMTSSYIDYMPTEATGKNITKENAVATVFEAIEEFNSHQGGITPQPYKEAKQQAKILYSVVKTAIDKGADVNAQNSNGNTMLMEILNLNNRVAGNANIDLNAFNTPEYLQTISYILDQNPNLKIENKMGINALDYAECMIDCNNELPSAANVSVVRHIREKYNQQERQNTKEQTQTQVKGKTLEWNTATRMANSR